MRRKLTALIHSGNLKIDYKAVAGNIAGSITVFFCYHWCLIPGLCFVVLALR